VRTLVAALFMLVVACGGSGATATSSPAPVGTAEPSPTVRANGHLDSAVAVPSGFPADIPVYSKARLTAGAAFRSNGQVSWGMEWQTVDAVDRVRAFYAQHLNQGDWTIAFGNAPSGTFTATFTRKSDAQVNGTLTSSRANGVTKISMSLAAPG
jgi:hypothetical protein